MIVRANWLFPVSSIPIRHGELEFHNRIITYAGPVRSHNDRLFSTSNKEEAIDYGHSVLIPGWVNAHTHLELSHLHGQVTVGRSLSAWLEQLVGHLRSNPPSPHQTQQAVEQGIEDSLRYGIAAIGDITASPDITRPLLAKDNRLRCVSFGEVIAIGQRRNLLDARLTNALRADQATSHMTPALSPHSPYTLEPEGLQRCATEADSRGWRTCIHLAESHEESEFTQSAGGPLADYLKRLGIWDEDIPASGLSPIELADQCGLLTSRMILAHANYVSPDDITLIQQRGCHVAYCPRTHAAFGHSLHPFTVMLKNGVNVCLGTDSLASNPSLSIAEEVRFLLEHNPELLPSTALAMGTLHGAKALGLEKHVGSLQPGHDAVAIALPCTSSEPATALREALLDHEKATILRG